MSARPRARVSGAATLGGLTHPLPCRIVAPSRSGRVTYGGQLIGALEQDTRAGKKEMTP